MVVPVWLPWRCVPDGEEKILHLKDLLKKTSWSFFRDLLGNGVSNQFMPSNRYSSEDMLSEFGGVAGRSDMMEGSDQNHLYF